MFFKKCFYCKKKNKPFTIYEMNNKRVYVCYQCKIYAERRALKWVKNH
jgi:hypothetical protein